MRPSSRTVLGVDPGLARVGYGVVRSQGNQLDLLDYGVIETPKHEPTGRRLQTIHRHLRTLIGKHSPDALVLEQLFFTKNVTTGMVVGEARGIALLAAAEDDVSVIEVTPTSVKQALTGYGRADKRQVQRMIQVLFRLARPPKPDDAADAIALALCGSNQRIA
ncbi:MAG: crossover junction endodeoxyribonuclease RuvC [Candidatus Kerfeldbacteria bacterium]|nr:crossover junction endodeoxyribonuclease RuvC [Candidatus Kerfeldbacteria bacterium]